MLPVDGLLANNIDDLSFNFRSVKVIYTIVLQTFCLLEFIMVSYEIFSIGMSFDYCAIFINYGIGIFTTLYMLYQATKWKKFMSFWAQQEEVFLCSPYSNQARSKVFARKVKFVGFCIIGFTISIVSYVTKNYNRI
jgi:Trehalose receptor